MQITGRWRDTGTATLTIAAPGAGRKNVLQSLNVIGDSSANITIQSPSGTNVWQTAFGAGGGGFDKEWGDDSGLFGAENQSMVISISAGSYMISVNGVIVG